MSLEIMFPVNYQLRKTAVFKFIVTIQSKLPTSTAYLIFCHLIFCGDNATVCKNFASIQRWVGQCF